MKGLSNNDEGGVIGGFNAMIKKQKKEEGKCYVSTVLFSDDNEVLHDRLDLNEIKPMTDWMMTGVLN